MRWLKMSGFEGLNGINSLIKLLCMIHFKGWSF